VYVEWHDLGEPEALVIEGVGSGSQAPSRHEVLVVWVEAPESTTVARGLERDGERARSRWDRWRADERELFATEDTKQRADLHVDGAPTLAHDPERQFVAIRGALRGALD